MLLNRPITAIILILAAFISCQREEPGITSTEGMDTIPVSSDLVIGLEDQPIEHQLGQPIAVRTDQDNNIYIADRASMTIKVYNASGNYLRSIGGRGRGPSEFQEMEFMELTPEGHLVIMDRGNFQYTIISTEGELIETFPYNFSDQFYPSDISYVDGEMLALFLDANPQLEIPRVERHLFHIYSTDFQQPFDSFTPFHDLNIKGRYAWLEMMITPGSFTLNAEKNQFIYSPGIYTGDLYFYDKGENGKWEYKKKWNGVRPRDEAYYTFSSETEYDHLKYEPGALIIYSEGGPYMGKVISIDLGIFWLNKGRYLHFFGERRENKEFSEGKQEYHYLDVYVQIFNEEGKLETYGKVFTIEERHPSRPVGPLVNWKDKVDNFYLNEYRNNVPSVRRFRLEGKISMSYEKDI